MWYARQHANECSAVLLTVARSLHLKSEQIDALGVVLMGSYAYMPGCIFKLVPQCRVWNCLAYRVFTTMYYRFGELVGKEVDIVTISRDTTEADLKQRREILNGSVVYVDQAPVRAAVRGQWASI